MTFSMSPDHPLEKNSDVLDRLENHLSTDHLSTERVPSGNEVSDCSKSWQIKHVIACGIAISKQVHFLHTATFSSLQSPKN